MRQLLNEIGQEFQQINNTLNQYEVAKYIKITVSFFARPGSYALVSHVAVSSNDDLDQQQNYATIFEASNDVAPQIFDRFRNAQAKKQEIETYNTALSDIDADDYNRAKGDKSQMGKQLLRMKLERSPSRTKTNDQSAELIASLETDLLKSDGFSEFQETVNQRLAGADFSMRQAEKTPIAGAIFTLGGKQHVVPEYINTLRARISKLRIVYQSDRREPIGPADAQRLLSLRVKKGGDRLFQAFRAGVTALIGVDIDAFEDEDSTSLRRPYMNRRIAKLDVDNFLVQANGSGVKEALRLMLNIELDSPDIILVEEPEIHLHPALEMSVMRYLRKKSETTQIFLTTHSTNFIDSGDYSSIQFVKKITSTKSSLLTAEDASEILPKELGLRPSTLFMFDKLLFVEGSSDEAVLREWATTLRHDLSRTGVGFINIEGSRNVKHFAAQKTADFLSRRGVDLWFLLDRDEHNENELLMLQRQIGPSCKVRFLPCREVKNLFATPPLLVRFVKSIAAERKDISSIIADLTVEMMACIIDKEAEALYTFALGKRLLKACARPVYITPKIGVAQNGDELLGSVRQALEAEASKLAQKAGGLEAQLEQIRVEFDETWKRDKLSIVPGDELLLRVFKSFSMSYIKSRDAKKLAAMMKPSEIPTEIRSLLGEITQAD